MRKSGPNRSIWKRDVIAWCGYDWANSGYTTLMITVFVVYIQQIVFSDQESTTGAVAWAWIIAISMLVGALLSPIVGALADARGAKRIGLTITALGGGLVCIAISMIPSDSRWLIVGFLFLANLCHELSLTFYNGFLPEIVDESEFNRTSAAGMSWGYFGGGLGLLLAMWFLNYGTDLGFGNGEQLLRICIFCTGIWWAVFSIPTILILRDSPRPKTDTNFALASRQAFLDVVETIKRMRTDRTLFLFLIAFLIYNDGVQTVLSQASTFALQEIKFIDRELVAVVLMIQFVATPGAILVGWISDKIGRKTALLWCLAIWIFLLGSAWFVQTKLQFWWLAGGVALVMGGTQSVSRAIMGSLTPKGQEARYFGFFNLSGKATSFLGTFVFGLIVATTGSSRLAIVNVLLFFVVGFFIISKIKLNSSQPSTDSS